MDWEPRVGMKVVCVDGTRNDKCDGPEVWPTKASVYTIRGIRRSAFYGTTQIYLAEINNPPLRYWDEPEPYEGAFNVSRFKPLRERKSDISVFRAMLVNPPKELVPASYEMPNRSLE